jgi:hypothetical protein
MEQILLPMEQSNKKEYIDKRSADFTNYPKLFRGSYWGCYNKLRESDIPRETIIGQNRNKIAEMFELKKSYCPADMRMKNINKKAELFFNGYDVRDHIEFYKNKNKKIVTLFSVQAHTICEERHAFILKNGYQMVDPLYDLGQKSYVKVLE